MLFMRLKYSGSQEVTEIGEATTAAVGEAPEDAFGTLRFANTQEEWQVFPQLIVPLWQPANVVGWRSYEALQESQVTGKY